MAVDGNYDDVNRLCTQIADRYGWGFANINLRSYYAEGAKTMGFEIAEQLGWRYPDHIVSPVAGKADILVVPDIESGNMLAKQLTYLAGADSAGSVLGVRVPIAVTSRADKLRSRRAATARTSCGRWSRPAPTRPCGRRMAPAC